ncbi:hypothetical protein LCGC14_2860450 [marine sediment metagenome]|uniref:Uncharacterized protein n=1 Tax=marine sediment metagenome TaxID=412755 RepID=A0A0F8YSH2_9ZZZZ
MLLIKKAAGQAFDEIIEIRNQILSLEDCIRSRKRDEQGSILSPELISEELREIITALESSMEWLSAINEVVKTEEN